MTITDPDLRMETLFPSGEGYPMSSPWISNPLDVMVDIDDVIFPAMMSIHELARQAGYHNDDVDPTWTGWMAYGIEEQAYWDLWSDFALSGGYTTTEPIQEAVEALRRLYFTGQRIHLVTARGFMDHASDIRAWTPQWLEEFGVPWHSLTFARNKVAAMDSLEEHFGPTMSTDPFFDYAIDDSPKNVDALRDAGVRAYLLNHVHNKDYDPEAEHRIPTVEAFVDMILEEELRG